MSYFPIEITYTDTNETQIINKSEDIQKYRPFTVKELNAKWGRKPAPLEDRELPQ